MKPLPIDRKIIKLLARAKEQIAAAAYAMQNADKKQQLWHLKDRLGVMERDVVAFSDGKRLLKSEEQIKDFAKTIRDFTSIAIPHTIAYDALSSASDILDALVATLQTLKAKEVKK